MKAYLENGEAMRLHPGQASYGNRFAEVTMTFDELLDVLSTEQGRDWFNMSLITRFPPSGRLTVSWKGELHG